MKKEFVPYEQALELKELGFDEPCFANYNPKFKLYHSEKNYLFNLKSTILGNNECKAPTFSQAFRFFREKYEYDGYFYSNTSYRFRIVIKKTFTMENLVDIIVDTYEEAELECLKKLIEIVKEDK